MYGDQYLRWRTQFLQRRNHPLGSERDIILEAMLSRAVEFDLAAGKLDPLFWDLDHGEVMALLLEHPVEGIRHIAKAVRDQQPYRHGIAHVGPLPTDRVDWMGWRVRHLAAERAAATAGFLPWQVAVHTEITGRRDPRLQVSVYFAEKPPTAALVLMSDLPTFCLQAVAIEDSRLPTLGGLAMPKAA